MPSRTMQRPFTPRAIFDSTRNRLGATHFTSVLCASNAVAGDGGVSLRPSKLREEAREVDLRLGKLSAVFEKEAEENDCIKESAS